MSTPPPAQDYSGIVTASNVLFLIVGGVACIPAAGFLSWAVAGPVLLVTFILSIVVMCRGGTKSGIGMLFMSILVMPLFVAIVPIVSTAFFGGAAGLTAQRFFPDPTPNPVYRQEADAASAAASHAPTPATPTTRTAWTYDPTLKRYVNHDVSVTTQQSYGGGGGFYVPRSSPTPSAYDQQRGWKSTSALDQRQRR